MVEPEKPFACTMPECGMTFTNEDHLNVHTRKHDMVLQFGCEQKAAVFVADQTPTPTRFIRNCEEVGLFQDLQNVNPFDEGFKRAIETKQGMLTLEGCASSEELHTPQMFPLLDGDYSATSNHRNITISRSSSDETGATKEFETTRISKLTNEVTTISRIVEKHDDTPKIKETMKNSVSYTNNVIKIHSNVEIRKDTDIVKDISKDNFEKQANIPKDTYEKNTIVVKDTFDRLQVDAPPIMSQKSIDFVVDSLTTDYIAEKTVKDTSKDKNINILKDNQVIEALKDLSKKEDYEVILKLPSGQEIKLVSAEKVAKPKNAKDLLKKVITEKVESQKIINSMNVLPTITSGTLIPVSIVNTNLVNTNLTNPALVTTNLATQNMTNKNLTKSNLVNTKGTTTSIINANLATTSICNPTLVTTNLPNTNLVTTNLENTNLVTTNLPNRNLMTTNLVTTNLANTNLLTTNLANTNLVTTNLANTNLVTASLGNATLVNYTPKLPIKVFDKRPIRRKSSNTANSPENKKSKDCDKNKLKEMECRSAASKRYRARLKETMTQQSIENKQLKIANEKLKSEKALLQALILEHMKRFHCAEDLREMKAKIDSLNSSSYEINGQVAVSRESKQP